MGQRAGGSGALRYTVDLGADGSYLLSLLSRLGPGGNQNSSLAKQRSGDFIMTTKSFAVDVRELRSTDRRILFLQIGVFVALQGLAGVPTRSSLASKGWHAIAERTDPPGTSKAWGEWTVFSSAKELGILIRHLDLQ